MAKDVALEGKVVRGAVPPSRDSLPPPSGAKKEVPPPSVPSGPSAEEHNAGVVADYLEIQRGGSKMYFANGDPNDGYALLNVDYGECLSKFYLRSDGLVLMKTSCGGDNPVRSFGDPKKISARVLAVLAATREFGVKADAAEVKKLERELKIK